MGRAACSRTSSLPFRSRCPTMSVLSLCSTRCSLAERLPLHSCKLAELRDALLPELLPGRIRVHEASEAVDQALA